MNRIAFYGPAASGKTWCADYIRDHYIGYAKVAFADKLKEIALDLFNVQGKNGNDRVILQNLGGKLREIDPEVWIKYLLKRVKQIGDYTGFVLDDLRYVNEAAALRDAGFTLIMVNTSREVRESRMLRLYPETPLSVYYHASEREWAQIVPDDFVVSETPEEAKKHLDLLMEKLNAR
jgi:hypothetical protein